MPVDTVANVVTSIGFVLYLFMLCLVLALLEIEIEGSDGWAAALPTWRFEPPWLLRLTSGKAITGYHLWLNLLLGIWLHLTFFFTPWTPSGELVIGGTYFFMAVQWDFLWFVLNPHFGIGKFSKKYIPWFRYWLVGFPRDYYVGLACSLGLWLLAAAIQGTPLSGRASSWFRCLLWLSLLTVCMIIIVHVLRWAGLGTRKNR